MTSTPITMPRVKGLKGFPVPRSISHSLPRRKLVAFCAGEGHTGKPQQPTIHVASASVAEDEGEWVEYYETVADTSMKPTVYASAPPPVPTPFIERFGSGAFYGAAAFLSVTFLVAVVNFWRKFNLSENRDRRKRLKNKDVVTSLSQLLPASRESVTKGMLNTLRFKTGFSSTEIFRKFLWYVLRDRQFNQDAIDDLLHLKQVMNLSDDDVAEALKQRSIRIEAKYGNLMLQTAGLSEKAVLKKATCRALFSKILYLVQNEQMLSPDNQVFNLSELRNIFGATEEDIQKLRIISLQEVDLDVLNSMMMKPDRTDVE